jgi:type IV pilus assembly protein PilY1
MSSRQTHILTFERLLAGATLALALVIGASHAHAQSGGDPDLRNLEPFVMVIVDTSGSMERKVACTCTTPGCAECLPTCPVTETAPPPDERNRWSYVLEALTGRFTDFRCNALARTSANGATYDVGYYLPYHQPWHCASGSACTYPATISTGMPATTQPFQGNNGVLDTYASTVRFGLMTFDGMETYLGANPLVHYSAFNTTLSASQQGMWSYGGPPHRFHYPNCTEDYAMDTGARSTTATEGGLISVNSTNCANPPCDIFQINASIQDALLRTRPYGGTPIAASLDDLYYHFKNDLSDTFGGCRNRYALLLTDGYPDDDYRSYGCDCAKQMNCPPAEDPKDMMCPYPLAEDVAHDLVNGRSGDTPQMSQLFVVGIGVSSTDIATRTKLNLIASQGGSPPIGTSMDSAIFVDDTAASLQSLSSQLDSVLSGLSRPVSRSVPAFVSSSGTTQLQYEISTGFQKAFGAVQGGIAPPWTGIIERKRIGCSGTTPTELQIDSSQGDRFQDTLNSSTGAESNRHLWTALPTSTATDKNGSLDRARSGATCGSTYCTYTELNTLTPDMFGNGMTSSDAARATAITDWMYGRPNSVRNGKRLGDVYHSSPTVPRLPLSSDSADPSYQLFLQQAAVSKRPLVMYVGTNDGILHAFSLEAYNGTTAGNSAHTSTSYVAGQEMWGFVPPMKLDELEAQQYGHQFSMDGTAVVKDAYFKISTTPAATDYHTVLVTGMRRGGHGYVALDVSDPIAPKFLWQFAPPDMGFTYGKPVIAQAEFDWDDGAGSTKVQKRGIVILPGGSGIKGSASDCNNSVTTKAYRDTATNTPYATYGDTSGTGFNLKYLDRADVQCWKGKDASNNPVPGNGRVLYFVDLETGGLIKELRLDGSGNFMFPSPVIGSPTVYPDTVGSLAKEGFVVDADGVIWRIDLTATVPGANNAPATGWTARPFHDIFWDGLPTDGEVTYETPILSLDDQHRLVIIVGTGDTDNFDKPTVQNRIVSLTELNVAPANTTVTPEHYKAAFNWEKRVKTSNGFVPSELITGSMALFEGRLFFASFISVVSGGNACDYGRGRLWSVDFQKRDPNDANGNSGTFGPLPIDLTAAEATVNGQSTTQTATTSLFNTTVANAGQNVMVFGLGATQPPSCAAAAPQVDTYFSKGVQKFVQSAPPSIWIVAQASGAKELAGSALGSIKMQLTRKTSFSRVGSWASSTD